MITTAIMRSSMSMARRTLVKVGSEGQGMVKARGGGQGRAYQTDLSIQPVPDNLKLTVDTFLDYVHPMVTADQFRHTVQLSDQFLKWPGPELQSLFRKFAQEQTNWMSHLWQVDYLSDRQSLLINVAGTFSPARHDMYSFDEQLWLAARIISAVLDFKRKLENQTVATQRFGGQDQCMNCFQHVFASCRIPAVPCDRLLVYPPSARHIIVMHNNQMFSVEVYGEGGRVLSTEQLYEQLREMTEHVTHEAEPVGVLTALQRDCWASVYQDLVQDENNKAVIDTIQRSLFVLSLDQCVDAPTPTSLCATIPAPITPTISFSTPLSTAPMLRTIRQGTDTYQMYHGGGVDANSCNRWLDKSLQMTVGAGGTWGLIIEHSAIDGTHVMLITDHVMDFIKTRDSKGNTGVPHSQVKPPVRLQLKLTVKAISAIEEAKQLVTSIVEELDVTTFSVEGVGKAVVKEWGMSPDAFIQLALQLAYHRINPHPCSIAEYVSKRCHSLGRLDMVLCTTPEALTFIQHMDSDDVTALDKLQKLREALDAHKRRVTEVTSGYGIEKHFQALKYLAVQYDFPVPPLFADPSFCTAFQYKVNSSQVPHKHEMVVHYLPEKIDGYACPYVLHDRHVGFSILSSSRQLGLHSSDLMTHSLTYALNDMCQLARHQWL